MLAGSEMALPYFVSGLTLPAINQLLFTIPETTRLPVYMLSKKGPSQKFPLALPRSGGNTFKVGAIIILE